MKIIKKIKAPEHRLKWSITFLYHFTLPDHEAVLELSQHMFKIQILNIENAKVCLELSLNILLTCHFSYLFMANKEFKLKTTIQTYFQNSPNDISTDERLKYFNS